VAGQRAVLLPPTLKIPATIMLAPFTIEILGLAAAMLTTLCWVPQAVRTIRTRDTRAISLITQCAFAAGVFLWLLYGLAIEVDPIRQTGLRLG